MRHNKDEIAREKARRPIPGREEKRMGAEKVDYSSLSYRSRRGLAKARVIALIKKNVK